MDRVEDVLFDGRYRLIDVVGIFPVAMDMLMRAMHSWQRWRWVICSPMATPTMHIASLFPHSSHIVFSCSDMLHTSLPLKAFLWEEGVIAGQ